MLRSTRLLLSAALTGAFAASASAAPTLVRMDDGKAPAPAPDADKKPDADKDKKSDEDKDKSACGGPNGCGGKKK